MIRCTMKPIKSLLVALVLFAPGLASAQRQGYYSNPPQQAPGGFQDRTGRPTWGGSIGLGGMHDDGSGITNCDNCANAPALELDGHFGGMLGPRFALMAEVQLNARTVHSSLLNGDTVLSQGALLGAAQYWIAPQLWIKGGLGFVQLQKDDAYVTYDYGTGLGIMGGIGFEIMSARYFAVDLQARIIEGAYNRGNDHVTSGTVGVGVSWF